MPRTKREKRKITLLEAQHRRLDALERWFEFVNDEREITPENFSRELLDPTAWVRGKLSGGIGLSKPAEVKELKMKITHGLKALADGRQWIIPGTNLGRFNIVISEKGTDYEGEAGARSLLGIADLLKDGGWRSACCSWCGKLFVRKKRGTYCGLKCSQRMRTFKVRDPRWRQLIAAANRAGVPLADWLQDQRKKPDEEVCAQCGGALGPLAQDCPLPNCKYRKREIEEQP